MNILLKAIFLILNIKPQGDILSLLTLGTELYIIKMITVNIKNTSFIYSNWNCIIKSILRMKN